MKKRIIASVLAAVMIGSSIPAYAATTTDIDDAIEIVSALGIFNGNPDGDMNLTGTLTRAEFAKVLVCASTLKDSVAATGNSSPFSDVPYTHWAANYIKTAVEQGWLTGYLDGTYRPENNVTTAEAASAVLKLIGYSTSDMYGTYPEAQMALWSSTGLGDDISAGATDALTREECIRLFYNLLDVETKTDGDKYVVTLGYSLDSDGNPDYSDILQSTMDGPVILTNGNITSTIGFTPTTVYRDSAVSSTSALQSYDVIYYNKDRSVVWAYSRKITGTLSAVSPSRENPTSVTVSGVTYDVSSSTARKQLGTEGGLTTGSSVTLLIGKDETVVAAYDASTITNDFVGLIIEDDGVQTYTTSNGATYTATTMTILSTDGNEYTIQADPDDWNVEEGYLVLVDYTTSGTTITKLKNSSVTGKVTTSGIGSVDFAEDVEILDIADDTTGTKVYPSRIAGLTLTSSDVDYVEYNTQGEITRLVLDDVTGDAYDYGIVLTVSEKNSGMSVSGEYTMLINGTETTLRTSNSIYNISTGPSSFIMDGTDFDTISTLTEVKNITSINSLTVKGDTSHTIWDYAAVYVEYNDKYTQMDKDELNLTDYDISAYYDKSDSDGGRIRIIIAEAK